MIVPSLTRAQLQTDARKTKLYGQYGKKIIMAVKEGGSSSPDANKQLRDVLAAAKVRGSLNGNKDNNDSTLFSSLSSGPSSAPPSI